MAVSGSKLPCGSPDFISILQAAILKNRIIQIFHFSVAMCGRATVGSGGPKNRAGTTPQRPKLTQCGDASGALITYCDGAYKLGEV